MHLLRNQLNFKQCNYYFVWKRSHLKEVSGMRKYLCPYHGKMFIMFRNFDYPKSNRKSLFTQEILTLDTFCNDINCLMISLKHLTSNIKLYIIKCNNVKILASTVTGDRT